jgi:hypothetical protein
VGVRLPDHVRSHCEIHRGQCQTAQVSEVGEFLPVSTHVPEQGEHSEEEPQQSPGRRPAGSYAKAEGRGSRAFGLPEEAGRKRAGAGV